MVYIEQIRDSGTHNCQAIGITNGRGVNWKPEVAWDKRLAPDDALYRKYLNWKANGVWNRDTFLAHYVPSFIKDLAMPDAVLALDQIKRYCDGGGDLCLFCYCTDESLCHRSIVAGVLTGMGVAVENRTGNDYSWYYGLWRAECGYLD